MEIVNERFRIKGSGSLFDSNGHEGRLGLSDAHQFVVGKWGPSPKDLR